MGLRRVDTSGTYPVAVPEGWSRTSAPPAPVEVPVPADAGYAVRTPSRDRDAGQRKR